MHDEIITSYALCQGKSYDMNEHFRLVLSLDTLTGVYKFTIGTTKKRA